MKWRNWSGSVTCSPRQFVYLKDEQELLDLIPGIAAEGATARIVGSGHSFVPLVASDLYLLSLKQMSGLLEVGPTSATVLGGTRIHDLGPWLWEKGLAQENLGDIDRQTIAGAISSGTHGTGLNFGSLSTQVSAMRLISGTGEVLDCSAEQNPELLDAARLSLGSLGLITRVTLNLQPSFNLLYQSRKLNFSACLEQWPDLIKKHRHLEFYWFPFSDKVQLKTSDMTREPRRNHGITQKFNAYFLENGAFWGLSQLCRIFPPTCAPISRLCAKLVETGSRVDHSFRIFTSQRLVRFQEMEYGLPLENLSSALQEIRQLTQKNRYRVHFPLEIRFAAADHLWLSPCYRRETAFVAVHMLKSMPYLDYFKDMERILCAHEGRPHWGKWHSMSGVDLEKRYPRWTDFLNVRQKMDPKGLFLSPYLKKLFNL